MKEDDRIPVTAIFDIGKTNKKFLLFDPEYEVVFRHSTELDQTEDEDGDPCEDLEQLVHWIRKQFNDIKKDSRYRVEKLNFSTYGASFVHIDEEGQPVTPLYNYLKEYPEELLQSFYEKYGGREQFSVETASPPMGMLNSGLQLYWLKHRKSQKFDRIHQSLHFPQYISYLFTGETTAELTSIGCHTGMWDFENTSYHQWLADQQIEQLLPEVEDVRSIKKSGRKNNLEVGIGIHDSSAALAPYLLTIDDPFLLVSTGTWSISFNPFNRESLTYDELKRDCLCYMNIYGKQVKAARLFLGKEYIHQKKKLEAHFNRESTAAAPEFDPGLLKKIIQEDNPQNKLQLEQAHSSGPYPSKNHDEWNLDFFDSYQEAYHQLMLDLVTIQAESIELAEGDETVEKLIVTGGFSQNSFYVKMLASRFPDKKVYTASLSNASALGAALVINDSEKLVSEGQKELLDLKRHKPHTDLGMTEYRWR